MAFAVIFKPLAQLEVDEAYVWYQQDHIKMGAVFLDQLGRTCEFLSSKPYLYPDLTHLNLTERLAAMEALWGLTQPQPQPSLARTSVGQAPRRTDSRAGQALGSG